MIERAPPNMGEAVDLLIAPTNELQVVIGRVIAKPVDVFVIGDARFAHRRPNLDDPTENSEMLVNPIPSPADHRLGVITELVIDGDVRVTGELGPFLSGRLVDP